MDLPGVEPGASMCETKAATADQALCEGVDLPGVEPSPLPCQEWGASADEALVGPQPFQRVRTTPRDRVVGGAGNP